MAFASTLLPDWVGVYAALAGVAARLVPGISASPASRRHPALPTITTHTVGMQRLPLTEQWSKLSDILQTAVGRATAAQEMQISATRQLDLAQYALTTLADELSAVMTLPGRRSRTATLHMFANGQDAMAGLVELTGSSHALAA